MQGGLADITVALERNMTGSEIRQKFVDYFVQQGHRHVRSSSLVPANDPTLLFTNAGMNQFKDVFLGLEQRDYSRAVTVQKCVRAGGKHNDLENVGRTARHHTFFEMLGNFSFGDYFKKEAIAFAWELVTSPGWFGFPADKLYVTVFGGAEVAPGIALGLDEEAREFWKQTGVRAERIEAIPGLKENFWAMGDTGPCGPCSEIFYDFGSAASEQGHTDCQFPCDCGRYVEIWNLVFMQFNRDASGRLAPLPRPCVDTGAGLERMAAAQLNLRDSSKISNYDTDLLRPLIEFGAELSGKPYGASHETDISLRILADHSRAAAFLVSDGVLPANEGRGYVLRKIIRRAVRHGRMLGLEKPFLHEMARRVAALMGDAYPEVREHSERAATIIRHEEERYEHTLTLALRKLDEEIEAAARAAPTVQLKRREDGSAEIAAGSLVLPGEVAFRLYDTYGLSLDLLEDEGSWRGFRVDREGFEREMEKQRERAKASWKGAGKEAANPVYARLAETFRTEPDFYFGTSGRDLKIEAIVTPRGAVAEVRAGEEAEIVLDRTPFYAEAGGQVADTGFLRDNSGSIEVAEVRGAYYPVAGLIAHRILAKETLRVGDRVSGFADAERREHIKRNHTATHLVHAALRNILGTHVKQSGSLVAPDRLRFDFTHFTGVDPAELRDIEQQVNEEILKNAELETDIMALDDALASGALAFFGDKYPEKNVRVVTIPDPAWPGGFYSKELCGGTHVRRTGEIGVVKILAEQSAAAGIRRVEAVSGEQALARYQHALATVQQLAAALGVPDDQVVAAVERLNEQMKQLEKQLDNLKRRAAQSRAEELMERVRLVKDVRVIAAQVPNVDRAAMRQLVDTLRQRLGSGVVVLGTAENGKVALVTGVTKDLTRRLHAGKIVQELAREVGGSGGGRPDLAEAGGKDTQALEQAIAHVYEIVERML
jgi:alanyl-tRNA synthetase